mgnify:CR=1 FL=1|tara:strand:- start:223 stop:912 length:690 start_codon:yes stop_codon:yes gene_type:complete
MKILGIDTSSPAGSVALLDKNQVVSESMLGGSQAYSYSILEKVDTILNRTKTKLKDLEGFAITNGPGSFTGLRVGMSLLKGLVMATEKPFVSVNTLDAYAETVEPGSYLICPVLDARKKEVYTALFNSNNYLYQRKTPDQAITPAKLCDQISQPTVFVGNGLEVYKDTFISCLKENYVQNTPMRNLTVAASASLIALRNLKTNLNHNLDSLTINYIRPSEAELNYTASK